MLLAQEAQSFFTHNPDCDTMIRAVIWDLRSRNDSSEFVHNFIGDKGIAYWDAGVIFRDDSSKFSMLIPVAATSNTFAGFIGADNADGYLRVRYAPFDSIARQDDDVSLIANYFRGKLYLSDTIPGLRIERSGVKTKYYNEKGEWCWDAWVGVDHSALVYKGTYCNKNFLLETEFWHPIDGDGGGGDFSDFGGGGGGGGGGNPPPKPPEEPKPDEAKKPCNNAATGKANPLMSMISIPSSEWNYKGGLFGWVRTKIDPVTKEVKPKHHNGIDLYAPIGTPIYAVFGGVVTKVVNHQVNRLGKSDEYPSNYDGDINAAGNRVSIESYVNGKKVVMSYWHLYEDNVNRPVGGLTESDIGKDIKIGDLIGHTGITGNANQGYAPHLHVSAQENYDNVDPSKFFNATFTVNKDNRSVSITTPCD